MSWALLENAYCTIKQPVKNLYNLLPDENRLGSHFSKTYDFLEQSEWWSREQHESYQMQQIKKLLEHAYQNVPYYRRLFDEGGIKPSSIQDFDDLKRLPFLTRKLIQENLRDLVAANYKKKDIIAVTTGGSTSLPLGFYEDRKRAELQQKAFVAHQWSRVGYDRNKRNRIVILRGIPIKGTYKYNGNNLILSSYKMSKENMERYIELINRFNPDFLHVYPSTIALLSSFIVENGVKLNLPNLKSVLTSSEKIVDQQKIDIEKVFGVRVFDLYGHAEHSCLAAECERSRFYHLVDEYGYTELIGLNGTTAVRDGEIGEIVCTGFNNYVVPFIRYRTGDLAVNCTAKCTCGRSYKLLKRIEGRVQEYLVDSTGSAITFTCSDDALWRVKDKVLAYQYVQDMPGIVKLRLNTKSGFSNHDVEIVKEDFLQFYATFKIEIELVDNIERTSRGKQKYLVQNIQLHNLTY